MSQIENQLKNLSNMSSFVSKIPIFEEESTSTIFSHLDEFAYLFNLYEELTKWSRSST